MGPFAYYSPLGLGFLLALLSHAAIRAQLPPGWSSTGQWLGVIGLGVAAGVLCQGLMIGVQGVVAQVLPVPVCRSIRGRAAAAIGFCLIAAVVLLAASAVLFTDSRGPAMLVAALAGVATAVAGVVYAWNWPVAVRDFADTPQSG